MAAPSRAKRKPRSTPPALTPFVVASSRCASLGRLTFGTDETRSVLGDGQKAQRPGISTHQEAFDGRFAWRLGWLGASPEIDFDRKDRYQRHGACLDGFTRHRLDLQFLAQFLRQCIRQVDTRR